MPRHRFTHLHRRAHCGAMLLLLLAATAACTGRGATETVVARFEGETSFYADKFEGRLTANGETFTQGALTAAHRELPFGTRLRVTEPESQKWVIVRVNDRGPYAKDRVLDLSRRAAEALDIIDRGTAHVTVEVLADPEAPSE